MLEEDSDCVFAVVSANGVIAALAELRLEGTQRVSRRVEEQDWGGTSGDHGSTYRSACTHGHQGAREAHQEGPRHFNGGEADAETLGKDAGAVGLQFFAGSEGTERRRLSERVCDGLRLLAVEGQADANLHFGHAFLRGTNSGCEGQGAALLVCDPDETEHRGGDPYEASAVGDDDGFMLRELQLNDGPRACVRTVRGNANLVQ